MKKVLANDLRTGSHSSESPAKCADGPALPWMLVVLDRDSISSSQMRDLDWDVEEFAPCGPGYRHPHAPYSHV